MNAINAKKNKKDKYKGIKDNIGIATNTRKKDK